jgi:zinc D-Ala-D-Ala dipeptidase
LRGVRLLIVECHRPLDLQEAHWEENLKVLQEQHPDRPEEELTEENAKSVAPPQIIPPHSTGGAVDLVLVDADEQELDMGSPLNETGPLMRTLAGELPETAKDNRRMLLVAMEGAGFANYGHEWWHFSYGDRYWAYAKGVPFAIYGFATLDRTPGDEQW